MAKTVSASSIHHLVIAAALALGGCAPAGEPPATAPQAESSGSGDETSPVEVVEKLVDSLVVGWDTDRAKKDGEHFTVRFVVEGRSAALVVTSQVSVLKGQEAVTTPHDVQIKLSRDLAGRITRHEVTLQAARPEFDMDNPDGFDQVLKLRL
ncbi:MAG TPA: hypothetical protein VLC09_11860 [Polyangiaceae bacterium]|nr:hypothetical protein [Polyangiaceae bacterium]